MVIGNAGGGKSTLCRVVCAVHGLPYYSVDKINWKPNWVRIPEIDFNQRHDELLSQERWLIDGFGSKKSIEDRLNACDTVIFVDHPVCVHLWWATKRQLKSVFLECPDAPEGCAMWKVTLSIYKIIWRVNRKWRPRFLRAIYKRTDSIRIIHINSPNELNSFTAHPF